MTDYLTLEMLLLVAERALGKEPLVRDYGLLESALTRPTVTVYGRDAYPSVTLKAAALLHSLARNSALVDANKRLAWHATAVFFYLNGVYLDAPDDAAYELVMAVATGEVTDVGEIAKSLAAWGRAL